MGNKVFIKILLALVYLALLSPVLFFRELFFPYVTSKVFYFRIIIELALPFYFYLVATNPKYRPNFKNPLTITILVFFVISLVSALSGVNTLRSLYGNFERMGGVFSLLHLVLLYFYILLLCQVKADYLKQILFFTLIISGLSAFHAALTKIGLFNFLPDDSLPTRVSGTLGNPIFFASYLIIPFFLSLFFSFWEGAKSRKLLFITLACFQLVAIFLSGTRGAIVGLAAGIAAGAFGLLVFSKGRKFKLLSLSLLGVLIVVAGSLFFFRSHFSQNGSFNRLLSFGGSNTEARLVQWKDALRGFTERPMLGTGPENYYVVSNKYFDHENYLYDASWFDKPHNYFVEILVTNGILGFIAYLGILLFAIWGFYRGFVTEVISLPEFALLLAALVSFVAQNLFVFDTIAASLVFFLLLVLAAFLWEQSRVSPGATFKSAKKFFLGESALKAGFGLLGLFMLYLVYAGNIAPAIAAYYLNNAFVTDIRDPAAAQNYYQKAITVSGNFDSQLTSMRYEEFASRLANLQLQNQGLIDLANKAIDGSQAGLFSAAKTTDNHPILWYKLANTYILKAFVNKQEVNPVAEEYINKALDLAPGRYEALYILTQLRLMQHREAEAINIIEQIVNKQTNPNYGEARWRLALVYFEGGRKQEAYDLGFQVIKDGFAPSNVSELNWLIVHYENLNDLDKLVTLYESAARLDPNTAQRFADLANIYAQVGDKAKAIEAAKMVLKLAPQNRAQVEEFLKSLEPI